jgi:hypothetical protein
MTALPVCVFFMNLTGLREHGERYPEIVVIARLAGIKLCCLTKEVDGAVEVPSVKVRPAPVIVLLRHHHGIEYLSSLDPRGF